MKKEAKKTILKVILTGLILAAKLSGYCQSLEGQEFWFTVPGLSSGQTNQIALLVTGRYDAQITVDYPARPGEPQSSQSATLQGGSQLTLSLASTYVDDINQVETVQKNGFRVTSDMPVALSVINYETSSSEVSPVFPAEKLGTDYFTTAYREITSPSNDFNARINLVAAEDNTTVTITLPAGIWTSFPSNGGQKRAPSSNWTVTLNQGESYSFISNDNGQDTSVVGNNPGLSGVHIQSDKPIVVIGGADCTWIGNKQYPGCGNCDLTFGQLLPLPALGTTYVAVQTLNRKNNRFPPANTNSSMADYLLITAVQNATMVNITGKSAANKSLNRGESWLFESPGSGTNPADPGRADQVIRSDKPVMVNQLQKGWACDELVLAIADPLQLSLQPETSWKKDYILLIPKDQTTNPIYPNNELILIVKDAGNAGNTARGSIVLTVNGINQTLPGSWTQIGTEPYYYQRVPAIAGVVTVEGDSVFGVNMVGKGGPGSYASTGGATCRMSITASADTVNLGDATQFSVQIQNGGALLSADWQGQGGFSSTAGGPSFVFPDTGRFQVTVQITDVGGCKGRDTLYAIVIPKDSVIVPPVDTTITKQFRIPSAFSPNGDGINDEFKCSGEEPLFFSMLIFNRWGEKVFETKKMSEGWKALNITSGVYIYEIKVQYGTEPPKPFYGSVMVVK